MLQTGLHGILMRHTVPPPVLPSKAKKFAIGDSRAASALRISCANIPPTTAQTGDSSCAAVVDSVLSAVLALETQKKK